ncbi:hypothetical protein [Brachybacterium sp. UNK5269]|uniref:hypothetical protein n=1 Tax=Brachybacterium sp. UNK5269 TaxID=3408576 RepID=UPI003BB157D7
MTVQTAAPAASRVVDPTHDETRAAQVQAMEATAHRALSAIQGVRTARMWVEDAADGTTVRGDITVAKTVLLPTVVSEVTDNLVAALEDIQGRRFDRHELNFVIAAPSGPGAPQQTLTIT